MRGTIHPIGVRFYVIFVIRTPTMHHLAMESTACVDKSGAGPFTLLAYVFCVIFVILMPAVHRLDTNGTGIRRNVGAGGWGKLSPLGVCFVFIRYSNAHDAHAWCEISQGHKSRGRAEPFTLGVRFYFCAWCTYKLCMAYIFCMPYGGVWSFFCAKGAIGAKFRGKAARFSFTYSPCRAMHPFRFRLMTFGIQRAEQQNDLGHDRRG